MVPTDWEEPARLPIVPGWRAAYVTDYVGNARTDGADRHRIQLCRGDSLFSLAREEVTALLPYLADWLEWRQSFEDDE